MRTKKVSRHYCDFCGKGMFKIPSMEKHERGCTLNPNRVCGMCKLLKQEQIPIENLKSFAMSLSPEIQSEPENEAVPRYRNFCGGCPACMLAGIRQAKLCTFSFDFKAEVETFWSEQNLLTREDLERENY